jgi:hypothetical protein
MISKLAREMKTIETALVEATFQVDFTSSALTIHFPGSKETEINPKGARKQGEFGRGCSVVSFDQSELQCRGAIHVGSND